MRLRMTLEGSRELEQTLRTLSTRRAGAVLRHATMAAMKRFAAIATPTIPVRTGALRTNMRTYRMRPKTGRGGARYVWPSRAALGIAADARGYYPASLEYGWRTRLGKSGRGVNRYVPPKTRLRDLLQVSAQMLLAVFERSAWASIRRFIARDAKKRARTQGAA